MHHRDTKLLYLKLKLLIQNEQKDPIVKEYRMLPCNKPIILCFIKHPFNYFVYQLGLFKCLLH